MMYFSYFSEDDIVVAFWSQWNFASVVIPSLLVRTVFLQVSPLIELACLWKMSRFWENYLTYLKKRCHWGYCQLGGKKNFILLNVMWKCTVANHWSLSDCLSQKGSLRLKVHLGKKKKKKLFKNVIVEKGPKKSSFLRRWSACFAAENGLQRKRLISADLFSLVSWGKSCLEYQPFSGDCMTGQWETHLQRRNKEGCFAYQLLTTSRGVFACCCLWFCRCMPSNSSRVMDPFPRKLHWNISTVTFA